MKTFCAFLVLLTVAVHVEGAAMGLTGPTTEANPTTIASSETSDTLIKQLFHPKPERAVVTQIIPPEPTSPTENHTFGTSTEHLVQPQSVLENKPTPSFHHPVTTGNPETAKASKVTKPHKATIPPNLIDRFPELTTLNKKRTTADYAKPQTVLVYKPIISDYHPHPVTPAQIIPPGKPWPASAEGYETQQPGDKNTSSSTAAPTSSSTHIILTYKTKKPSFLPQPGVTMAPIIPPGQPWPTLPTTQPQLPQTTTEDYIKPQTVLEYKPIQSGYHPHPVTVAQIIPPGSPWPASPTENQTKPTQTTALPNLVDRFPELSSDQTTSASAASDIDMKTTTAKPPSSSTHLTLTYKPQRPSFLPQPGVTVAQIIPPSTTTPNHKTTLSPNLIDRFPELGSIKTTTTKTPQTTLPEIGTTTPETTTGESTRIILTYKPQRPWYHPRPGNTIGQIIPPGKPWPASPEGYQSFSVTTHPPWLKESDSLPHFKPEDLQSLKEDPVLLEPNALQYIGPRITAPPRYTTPKSPFTSGTQKTTLSDIVDILKEVHNITIVSNRTPPTPSHLLPFDADRVLPQRPSQVHLPVKDYGVVVRPQRPVDVEQPVYVHDGVVSLQDAVNRGRVFPNPKFVQS